MSYSDGLRKKIVEITGNIDDLPVDQQAQIAELAKETLARHDDIGKSTEKSMKALRQLEDIKADISLAIQYALFDAECVVREVSDRR